MPMTGELKDLVQWQMPVRTISPAGTAKVVMTDVGKPQRVKIVENRGREMDDQEQQKPVHTHRIEFRGRTNDVRHDWVAVWKCAGGTTDLNLEIFSVAPLTGKHSGFMVALAKVIPPSTGEEV